MTARIVTFGEIMGRCAAPGFLRLCQSLPGTLDVTFAGAEANVATSLAILGADVSFVTALPKHAIANACVAQLRAVGVDTRHILRVDQGRLGLYFLESGANQRPSNVIYDRECSSIALTPATQYDWDAVLAGGQWFHITGITPAISRMAAEAAQAAVASARRAGLTISCDLNFRKKLWRWGAAVAPRDLAEQTIRGILPMVDVLFANEEDCADVLGIQAGNTDVASGQLRTDRYPEVARRVVEQFGNIGRVAITLRESISASHNNWGGMLYCRDEDRVYFAPLEGTVYRPYEIRNIVDRVGSGDSFAAGLIFALTVRRDPAQEALRFAVAASCLAHSIVGDSNFSERGEIEALLRGSGSGRVVR